MTKVFISYSHDSPAHAEQVRGLSASLSRDGCECRLDVFKDTDEDWPMWMTRQLIEADFVLCVVTETYARRFRNQELPDQGLGVGWEAGLIRRLLYAKKLHNDRIFPVLCAGSDRQHIPLELQGYDFFLLDGPAGYETLLRKVLNRPLHATPATGTPPNLETMVTSPSFARPSETPSIGTGFKAELAGSASRPQHWANRLTHRQWIEFTVEVILTICMWVYLLESHDLLPLVGFAICLLVCYTIGSRCLCKLLNSLRMALAVCCLLTLCTCAVVIVNSRPAALKPHLVLLLNTSDCPRVDLIFTNHFLFLEYPKPKNDAPFLIIPVTDGRTNVVLTFRVWNDSASPFSATPDPLLTADGVELRLLVFGSRPEGRQKWTPGKEWRCEDVSETNASMIQLTHHFLSPIIPGASEPAPEIRFDISEDFSEPMLVRASVRARTVPITLALFHLAILRSDRALNPSFETNDIVAMRLKLAPENGRTNSN